MSPSSIDQEKKAAPLKEDASENGASTERKKQSEQYFPEDERSPMDWEDDHSHTDLDLDAEIEAQTGRDTAVGGKSPHPREEFHDTDDVRPCPDFEDDHSHTDFDLDAEIEAKLGKAEEEPQSTPSVLSQQELSPVQPPAETTPPDGHEDFHDPEDDRPCFEWEEDHSNPDFDVDAEIEAKLGKEPGAPDSAVTAPVFESTAASGQEHFPEDERSPMDWEDDHSHTDFDLDAEIEAKLGAEQDASGMHPDLAAALAASQAFAERGYDTAPAPGSTSAQVPPDLHDDDPPSDSPEVCTEDDCYPQEQALADGSLSPSGYMDGEDVPASPYAESGEEESAPSEPLPAAAASKAVATKGDSAASPAEPAEEDEEEEDEEEEEEESSGGGDSGGGDGDEESGEDQPMSLRDHLRDLRKRILRAFLWMLAGFLICYPFAEQLFNLLMTPLIKAMPETSKLIFTSPPEAFFTFLKVAFVAGIFLSSPLVFYQIWAFIAPGLYKEEKLYVLPVAFFSALFFISGGAFCYFIGFPFVFEFFMSYNKGLIQAMPSLNETLSFVLQLLLAFGLVFELPLFVFFLSRLGIVTAEMMRKFRRYSVLVNVIVAAILTPPDVMSQMLMAGPLIILYEISIIIAAVFGKKKAKPEEDKDEEDEEDDEDEDEADGSGNTPAVTSVKSD